MLGTVIYAFGHTTLNSSAINFIFILFFLSFSFPLTLCNAMLGVPIIQCSHSVWGANAKTA